MTKIFNYPWHIGHQYELMKIPDTKWTWLVQHRRPYGESARGDMIGKFGVEYVPHYEPGKYDVAVMHLDQQCFEEGILDRGKGSLTREVGTVVQDIPKVIIMHGTPYYPEMFGSDISPDNYSALGFTKDQIGMSSELIHRFQEFVRSYGIDFVIFNSYRARSQWGFDNNENSRAIWHGLDTDEWKVLPKEPRVVTMISPAGLDKYYDRTFLAAVKEKLEEKDIHHCHISVDVNFKNPQDYQEFLGRSLIYFNPTRESPMPRSRTEAMLSGCCVITTANQDAERFIKDGENGLITNRNPDYVVRLVEALIYDYKKAIEIGQKGRETALELFQADRFRREWREVLDKVTSEPLASSGVEKYKNLNL